jgi:hypothetical protein
MFMARRDWSNQPSDQIAQWRIQKIIGYPCRILQAHIFQRQIPVYDGVCQSYSLAVIQYLIFFYNLNLSNV